MVFNGFHGSAEEFAMGSLLGVRGFRIDSMGRLTGWTHKAVWRPGENVAECYKKVRNAECRQKHDHSYTNMRSSCYEPGPCTKDITECDHGFWAYFNDMDGEDNPDIIKETVPAIIRGYGKTVVGTKGFRASKAIIVAVTLPQTKIYKTAKIEVEEKVGNDIMFSAPLAALGLAVSIALGIFMGITYGPFFGLSALISFGIYLSVAKIVAERFTKTVKTTKEKKALMGTMPHPDKERFNLLYPDVKVFDTKEEMMSAYPTVDLTPTDPSDPAFWAHNPDVDAVLRRKEIS